MPKPADNNTEGQVLSREHGARCPLSTPTENGPSGATPSRDAGRASRSVTGVTPRALRVAFANEAGLYAVCGVSGRPHVSSSAAAARYRWAVAATSGSVRIEPGMQARRIYEVLAFMPNRGELAEQVNGQPWREGAYAYPNVVVFKPFVSFPVRSFRELVDELRYDEYRTGARYEARFIPVEADDLMAMITQLGPRLS